MVIALKPPASPLPRGGNTWSWKPRVGGGSWAWCRVYHLGTHNRDGHTARTFGPLHRFDPQQPDSAGKPREDPTGRSVLYIGSDLAASLCEVFGETEYAPLCPRWRVAVLAPRQALRLFDLCAPGSAMKIGALPALADGALPRSLTQQWARAIYQDQPARFTVTGIRYRSAYNGAISLALWDSAGLVDTVRDSDGRPADLPLGDPALLGRVRAACTSRQISLEVISSTDCRRCITDP